VSFDGTVCGMYGEQFTVERAKSALAAIISSLESPQNAGDLFCLNYNYNNLLLLLI
jgi:hypothetical protein